jgi:hypothetical protein
MLYKNYFGIENFNEPGKPQHSSNGEWNQLKFGYKVNMPKEYQLKQ